jgi:hypothetical protein
MHLIKSRAFNLIYGSDLHATRLLLGIAELAWAIALFWPGDTFSRPTYSVMALVAPETCWAIAFLITSFLQFHILLYTNYHSKFAVIFAGWNSFLWIFTVFSMYMGVYPPPAAISGELAMALGATWVFIRTGVPCFTYDAHLARRAGHAHNR